MPLETAVDGLVVQLGRVGRRPPEQLITRILQHGAAARGALIGLAPRIEFLHEDEPACWGPLHALRLLGEMPDVAIIPPLLNVLPIEVYSEEDIPAHLWGDEVLQMIGRCGAAAVPVLWAWSDDPEHSRPSRGAALEALTYATVMAPETRESVITEARRRFAEEQDPSFGADLVNILAELRVESAYAEIMAAYRAGRIDRVRRPAALVRQLLLGGAQTLLDDTKLSFWERYDKVGPWPTEQ